jgi:hypothetical protein
MIPGAHAYIVFKDLNSMCQEADKSGKPRNALQLLSAETCQMLQL